MKRIPLILVTGFLGSGKTTLLERLLQHYSPSMRIAIVQNEFAETGVDGNQLKDSAWRFELMEINTGSVFCVCLFAGFRESLNYMIEERHPDMVILEATGLADPIAVGELFNNHPYIYLSQVLTVIDARNYSKMAAMARCVNNQVRVADRILINKCDLANNLDHIEQQLRELNPFAEIVKTTFCDLDRFEILEPHRNHCSQSVPSGLTTRDTSIVSQVFRTRVKINRQRLDQFLKTIPPQTLRLKGYVLLDDSQAIIVQWVDGRLDVHPAKPTHLSSELTSLGYVEIDYKMLETL